MKRLTKKEEIIMNWFWDKGPLYVKELQELYPDPKPHFNTLSTQVRTLESNGYLKHNSFSGSFQYYPALSRDEYNGLSLDTLIGKLYPAEGWPVLRGSFFNLQNRCGPVIVRNMNEE